MYFGPFPAFLRIPLDYFYQSGRRVFGAHIGVLRRNGRVSRIRRMIRMALRSAPLSNGWKGLLGNACMLGFAFGSPLLLLLGNLFIYDEAIVWDWPGLWPLLYFSDLNTRKR